TTDAFQAAIDAARTGLYGHTVTMPDGGTCKLSETIVIANVIHFTLEGNNVMFTWAGPATAPMFLLSDVRDSLLRRFTIKTSVYAPMATGIRLENGAGTQVTPTHNVVEHVTIECVNGGCVNGVVMAQGPGGDANNEFNEFLDVQVSNVTNSCAVIEHS